MPIVIPDLSGINEGMGALSQALQQRAQKRLQTQQRGALDTALEGADLTTAEGATQFSKAYLKNRGDPKVLDSILKPYQPMWKQQARTKSAQAERSGILGDSQPLGQQVQQETEDLPPTMEPQDVPDEIPTTAGALKLPNGQTVTEEKIRELVGSEYEENRRLGEDYRKVQEREYKENSDVRKEHRAEIRKQVEPYSDFTMLKDKVSRMDQVMELVEKEGTNFDDNSWRNALTAIVEEQSGPALADTLKTPEQQKLFSLLRPLFGTKELGGSNPSTREMLMTLATLPGYTKTKEANRYIAKMLSGSANEVLETAKAMRSLRDKNLTVAQFQEAVEKKVEPIREENRKNLEALNQYSYQAQKLAGTKAPKGRALVFNPKDGKVYDIDSSEVEEAVELGALRFNAR